MQNVEFLQCSTYRNVLWSQSFKVLKQEKPGKSININQEEMIYTGIFLCQRIIRI